VEPVYLGRFRLRPLEQPDPDPILSDQHPPYRYLENGSKSKVLINTGNGKSAFFCWKAFEVKKVKVYQVLSNR
jgi:hypothetical protein